MKNRCQFLIPVIAVGLLLTAGTAAAQLRGSADGAPGRHWGTERTTAVAALEPVGAVEGWGRVMVMDLATEDDVQRMATVRLHGLEPDTEYTVTIDGVDLTVVTTDFLGDGWVQLDSRDAASDPIPGDLPPAADLMVAVVLDASLAPTLEGDFEIMTHPGADFAGLDFVERIHLESDLSSATRGIARVARDLDDVQYFESRACGLLLGETYRVTVDGFLAGVVTADLVGQGSIVLATDSGEGTLPDDLQPIEDLRQVEWTASGGDVVLWGTFTGENMVGHGGENGGGNDSPGDGDGQGSGDGNGGENGGGNNGDNGGGDGECDGGSNGDGNGGGGRP